MHVYDVHKTFNQSCEIHGPWVKGCSPKVWSILSNSESELNLRKYSFLLPYTFEKS